MVGADVLGGPRPREVPGNAPVESVRRGRRALPMTGNTRKRPVDAARRGRRALPMTGNTIILST